LSSGSGRVENDLDPRRTLIRRASHHAIDLGERPLDALHARPARHSIHAKLQLFHH
jgi:hypothetical protein